MLYKNSAGLLLNQLPLTPSGPPIYQHDPAQHTLLVASTPSAHERSRPTTRIHSQPRPCSVPAALRPSLAIQDTTCSPVSAPAPSPGTPLYLWASPTQSPARPTTARPASLAATASRTSPRPAAARPAAMDTMSEEGITPVSNLLSTTTFPGRAFVIATPAATGAVNAGHARAARGLSVDDKQSE